MVKIMASSAILQPSGLGVNGEEKEKPYAIVRTGMAPDTGEPSACIFWCAVAIGALVQGRPIESVSDDTRHIFTTVWSFCQGKWHSLGCVSFSRGSSRLWRRQVLIGGPNMLSQVAGYFQLATGALATFSGPVNAEVAK